MLVIYHNSRCQKSRLGVKFLEERNLNFRVVEYLKNPISDEELNILIKALGVKPIDIVRTNEKLWKMKFKGKKLSGSDIIKALINNPKLIERPIVYNGEKAIIGRPAEKINEVL